MILQCHIKIGDQAAAGAGGGEALPQADGGGGGGRRLLEHQPARVPPDQGVPGGQNVRQQLSQSGQNDQVSAKTVVTKSERFCPKINLTPF